MTRQPWISLLILSTLTLLCSGAALAGTTGKINGVVKDQKGAPLPGASVLIEGTRQGAVADADGYYVILNVPPGSYRLTASLIGYDKVTKSPVNVIADQTSAVDFSFRETAVQMTEVAMIAERPLVEPDKTTSKYVVSASEIQRMGVVTSTQDLLQLQPGVSVDGSNRIRRRGGSSRRFSWTSATCSTSRTGPPRQTLRTTSPGAWTCPDPTTRTIRPTGT